MTSAHDALKLSDASKASAIAKHETDAEELRGILATRNAKVSELTNEIVELRAQAEKERERYEEALEEAMRAGEDLEEERRALSGKLKRAKTGRAREKEDHEVTVQKMMEEMESKFQITEAKLRHTILAKSTELERALQRVKEMQEMQDTAAASAAAGEDAQSGAVVQQLQSEVHMLRRSLETYEQKESMSQAAVGLGSSEVKLLEAEVQTLKDQVTKFENGKAELLRAVVEARRRARKSFAEAAR